MSQDFVEFTSTSTLVPAAPSEAWRVLTNDMGTVFVGATFHTSWQQGDELVFEGDWQGNRYCDHGVVVTVEPDRRLQFTQFSSMSGKDDVPENYDLVTLDLSVEDRGTRVHLRLAKPTGVTPPDSEQIGSLTANLEMILSNLRQLCA